MTVKKLVEELAEVRSRLAGKEAECRHLHQELAKLNKKLSLDITKHAWQDLQNLSKTVEHQRKLLCAMVLELTVAEQRERQRLSLVLHDDLQQLLACLKLKLPALKVGGNAIKCIPTLLSHIDQGIDRCRNLANELSLPILTQEGFHGALEWLGRQMGQMYGMDFTVTTDPIPGIKSFALSTIR